MRPVEIVFRLIPDSWVDLLFVHHLGSKVAIGPHLRFGCVDACIETNLAMSIATYSVPVVASIAASIRATLETGTMSP